jgi:hypothetical protein
MNFTFEELFMKISLHMYNVWYPVIFLIEVVFVKFYCICIRTMVGIFTFEELVIHGHFTVHV